MPQVQPPDLRRPLRRPSERLALVEYIAASPTLQENEHLEWKSGYDLSRRPDAGKMAKQLIGFANRDPGRAQRLTGGYAYVLLGAKAGGLTGVPVWDSADIESWLSRFVPPELVYDVHYVNAAGKDVLVFEVDPPHQGDSIFCLQASTGEGNKNLGEGTIYVRRGGKTEAANASEIAMLTARAKSGAAGAELELDLVVDAQRLTALDSRLLEHDACQRWIEQARNNLMKGMPSSDLVIPPGGEFRSPARAREQVKAYLQQVAANWSAFAFSRYVAEREPSLTLAVTNRTDENFESVAVEITLPLPASCIGTSAEGLAQELSVAERPTRWGEPIRPKIPHGVFGAGEAPEVSAIEDQRAKVRFPPIHVYPQTTHPLDSLTLALAPEWASSTLSIEWRVTAANTRGLISGEVSIAIPSSAEGGPAVPAET